MKKINILIIGIVIVSCITSTLIIYDQIKFKDHSPTVLNTRQPSELCAIFDRTWNSYTQTCDYMNEVECGFSLGEWNECAIFDSYCHPSDTLCVMPTSCIPTCKFENSMSGISDTEP